MAARARGDRGTSRCCLTRLPPKAGWAELRRVWATRRSGTGGGLAEGPHARPTGSLSLSAQSHDLEEVMMDALVSSKPEFVRLFVDSGAELLTYGRLQQLYRSVPPKSLLFFLLQRKHEEGRLTWAGLGAQQAREPPAFSLHEVSRVFRDFLHAACRGFYQAVSCERAAGGGAGGAAAVG